MKAADAPPAPPDDLVPPEISVYVAPGMQTVEFKELIAGIGIPGDFQDWMEEVNRHVADLQAQLDEIRGDMQSQIDVLKSAVSPPDAAQAARPVAQPAPQQAPPPPPVRQPPVRQPPVRQPPPLRPHRRPR